MTSTKELFNKQTELRTKLLSVVKQDWFEECLVYAMIEAENNGTMSPDFHRGIRAMQAAITTLGDIEDTETEYPESGMIHNFDSTIEIKHNQPKS